MFTECMRCRWTFSGKLGADDLGLVADLIVFATASLHAVFDLPYFRINVANEGKVMSYRM